MKISSPILLCRVLRGISQSTAFAGLTPGLNFRLILLLRLGLVNGRPSVPIAEDGAGGGGLKSFSDMGESVTAISGSWSSDIDARVGRPL